MKSRKLSILWLALCGTLSGQFVGRPSAIETEIGKSGRFALFDRDQDGWDDLWAHLFPKIDVQNLAKDEDNDGKTNYEEMLDFTDPFRTDTKARELTPQKSRRRKDRPRTATVRPIWLSAKGFKPQSRTAD
jgi:hypothetical protein